MIKVILLIATTLVACVSKSNPPVDRSRAFTLGDDYVTENANYVVSVPQIRESVDAITKLPSPYKFQLKENFSPGERYGPITNTLYPCGGNCRVVGGLGIRIGMGREQHRLDISISNLHDLILRRFQEREERATVKGTVLWESYSSEHLGNHIWGMIKYKNNGKIRGGTYYTTIDGDFFLQVGYMETSGFESLNLSHEAIDNSIKEYISRVKLTKKVEFK